MRNFVAAAATLVAFLSPAALCTQTTSVSLPQAAKPAPATQPMSPAASSAPELPTVTFTQSFPGSVPVWYRIKLRQDGNAAYTFRQTAADPVQDLSFHASPEVTRDVFAWAAQLHHFSGAKLETRNNVSRLGIKTLAWDAPGGEHAEQSFNYSGRRPAMALSDLFERIASTAGDEVQLQRSLKYDPLGVPSELAAIARDWHQDGLAEVQIILPLLQRIAGDDRMMDIARRRAARLVAEMTRRRQ